MTDELRAEVERLSGDEQKALLDMRLPRDADPTRWIAARPYGSCWRKASKHRHALHSLERKGIVERTVSRGETLWRPTRPKGFEVVNLLRHAVEQAD